MIERTTRKLGLLLILLGIFGFASISLFIMWGALNIMGEYDAAEDVRALPQTLEDAKENATAQMRDTLSETVGLTKKNPSWLVLG